jgi:hypothetical protein
MCKRTSLCMKSNTLESRFSAAILYYNCLISEYINKIELFLEQSGWFLSAKNSARLIHLVNKKRRNSQDHLFDNKINKFNRVKAQKQNTDSAPVYKPHVNLPEKVTTVEVPTEVNNLPVAPKPKRKSPTCSICGITGHNKRGCKNK